MTSWRRSESAEQAVFVYPPQRCPGVLERARQRFVEEGYEVQTLRITTPPFLAQADSRTRDAALAPLQALDDVTNARDVRVSIGPVLAQRATEGRFGVHDLLLYSSVCGTGLDVVPLSADTPVEVAARLITDVATLASRLDKPLSARLFLIPGRRAGEVARFDDPYLTDCAVMPLR